jgi:hypothetical protein
MKNSVVAQMVCDQFRVDNRDLIVEFVALVDGTYEFTAIHQPRYVDPNGQQSFTKTIFIKVVDHN